MTEGSDTEVFQVLVCQIAEDREIDIVISKAPGVLGHPEFFEPIRNLLHRRPPTDLRYPFWTRRTEVYRTPIN
jgi:hypothetical protein